MQMEYRKIIRSLVAIDMSSNRFDGEIPESIGNLKEVHLLNFSNNNLDGRIPLAIAKMTNLEALDLSQNKIAGRIPWELSTQLTFLEFLSVPYNHLTGPIPQGHQFDTFQSTDIFTKPLKVDVFLKINKMLGMGKLEDFVQGRQC
ncbi:hypothetical protein DITRI_Ditri20bG0094200 [Diplodiscus trichospermus]